MSVLPPPVAAGSSDDDGGRPPVTGGPPLKKFKPGYEQFKTWIDKKKLKWGSEEEGEEDRIDEKQIQKLLRKFDTVGSLRGLYEMAPDPKDSLKEVRETVEIKVSPQVAKVADEILGELRRLFAPGEDVGGSPKWDTVEWPAVPEQVFERDDAVNVIIRYIEKVLDVTSDAWDRSKKAKILTMLGTKGIGKTLLLLLALKAAQERQVREKVKCVYATFNGCGKYETGDQLASFLLKSAGMDRDHAKREHNTTEALNTIRDHLGLKEGHVLLVAMDELCDVADDREASAIIREAMRLQDAFCLDGRPVVFLWSSLTESYIQKRASDSGRPLYQVSIPLHSLTHENAVQLLPAGFAEAMKKYPGVRQLVLECMGHPRSLCDGLQLVKDEILSSPLEPTTVQLQTWRTTILDECKFRNVSLGTSMLHWWFGSPCRTVDDGIDEEKLRVGGILHRDPNGGEYILPMLLRQWAAENQNKMALAYHLNRMYDCDCTLTATNEKEMEDVMVNFDAVRRIAVGDRACALGDYYAAAKVDTQLLNKMVRVQVPGGRCHVRVFHDFSAGNAEDIINALKEGYIVVSNNRTEQALEYLVPFLQQGQLLVAVVQCKFVQTDVDWAEIRNKLKGSFTDTLDGNRIKWFLVAYTTADLMYVQSGTTRNAVCYYEANLFDYTRPAGVLRLHLEKLGSRLKQQCAWLGASVDE